MDPSPQPHVTLLAQFTTQELRTLWPQWFDRPPPAKMRRELLVRALAYRMQERAAGGLTMATRTTLREIAKRAKSNSVTGVIAPPRLTPGTHVIREWGNERHQVTVEVAGFIYRGSAIGVSPRLPVASPARAGRGRSSLGSPPLSRDGGVHRRGG